MGSLKLPLVPSGDQGPCPQAEAALPGGTLTHSLVEGQEALVEASGPILRGGGGSESQPQSVPGGHELPLTRGAAQRGALLPTEPAWIHPTGCDLKGRGGQAGVG